MKTHKELVMAKLTIETDKDDGMNLWDALRNMLLRKDDVRGLQDDFIKNYNESKGFDQPINIHPLPDQNLMMGFPPQRPQALPPINPMDTMGLPMGPNLPY